MNDEKKNIDSDKNEKVLSYCPHCGASLKSEHLKKLPWGERPLRNSIGCLILILVMVVLFLLSAIMWVNP